MDADGVYRWYVVYLGVRNIVVGQGAVWRNHGRHVSDASVTVATLHA